MTGIFDDCFSLLNEYNLKKEMENKKTDITDTILNNIRRFQSI